MDKKAAQPIKDKKDILDIQDYLKSKNERDYILFLTGICTGYRAGDLVELKVRDVRKSLERGSFEILENKKARNPNTKKTNMIPRPAEIQKPLAKLLKEYIKNKKDYEYMFTSRKGINKHITVSCLGRILRDAGNYFELDHISTHSMRKTYGYSIYQNSGHNLFLVKKALGHSNIEDTERYIGLDREECKKYSDMIGNFIR